jgi:hypothetical protein
LIAAVPRFGRITIESYALLEIPFRLRGRRSGIADLLDFSRLLSRSHHGGEARCLGDDKGFLMTGSPNEKQEIDVPPDEAPAVSDLPDLPIDAAHRCVECNVGMTLLGRIPNNWAHRPIMVYRCYGCDNVVSVEA